MVLDASGLSTLSDIKTDWIIITILKVEDGVTDPRDTWQLHNSDEVTFLNIYFQVWVTFFFMPLLGELII